MRNQKSTDLVIANMGKAMRRLADAKTASEANEIADVARAAETYAKRQKLGVEAIGYAHAVKVEALNRLGGILKATPRNGGVKLAGRDSFGGTKKVLPKDSPPTLTAIGIDKKTSAVAQKLADLAETAPEQFAEVRDGTKSITQVTREQKEVQREAARNDNRAKVASVERISEARFSSILIDPPWNWGDEGDKDQLGRARPQYATLTLEQLLELNIPAADDCHLYLWITNRSLPKGFVLLERWGFRYITALTWVKPHFGMGNYFRGQTEHLLFGVRGSQMLKRKDVGTVLHAPRGSNGHSSKPIEIYPLIESCSPGPYLEMFSRCERPDWTAWGENS